MLINLACIVVPPQRRRVLNEIAKNWRGSSQSYGPKFLKPCVSSVARLLYADRSGASLKIGRHGHAGAAFTLAEQYRDFSSLASLCHKETVYPPEDNPHTLRIQAYFDRFKDEFAMELYRWYIQHGESEADYHSQDTSLRFFSGELRVMFAQEDAYRGYMDKFFASNPNTALSWIHDLGNGRHGAAAAALLIDAEQATNLEAKHVSLSFTCGDMINL
jgi:Non-repetitive/WGA-negative nucleoporin C-terminal